MDSNKEFKWTDELVKEFGLMVKVNSNTKWVDKQLIEFKASKQPKPILTTIDEVALFGSDNYYFIDSNWSIRYTGDNYNWVGDNGKFFFYKEKAEEYVLMNKPCLSVNDVKMLFDMFQFHNRSHDRLYEDCWAVYVTPIINELKIKAQSKIDKQ